MQPQTRKTRQAQMYREDLEKMRLAARRENYCHYEVRAFTRNRVLPPIPLARYNRLFNTPYHAHSRAG